MEDLCFCKFDLQYDLLTFIFLQTLKFLPKHKPLQKLENTTPKIQVKFLTSQTKTK